MKNLVATQTLNHNNNFNLLRAFAATAVLFSHCYPLTGNTREPLSQLTGITLGGFAVDIFFIMSGYLVTASLIRIQNIKLYFLARVIRIYPALILSSVFCVFAIGLAFTQLDLKEFLINPKVYYYLLHDSTIIFGTTYELPGVFKANPYPETVNGSLWTLRFELIMYVVLGMLTWLYIRKSPYSIADGFRRMIALIAIVSMTVNLSINLIPSLQENISNILTNLLPSLPGLTGEIHKTCHFAAIFFYGAALFCFQSYITFRKSCILILTFLLLLMLLVNHDAFFLAYNLIVGYLILSLAFLPSGVIRRFNGIGDYSYGIYIYAFPIQQSVMARMPNLEPLGLFAISLPITLVLAVASWHVVEKPFLRLKRHSCETKERSAL